ncbi:unnamed protein product [Pedinophyceae sp. YPF-701]|nr:unnamed protein product [Pedinophyceae sp. YPF-701]
MALRSATLTGRAPLMLLLLGALAALCATGAAHADGQCASNHPTIQLRTRELIDAQLATFSHEEIHGEEAASRRRRMQSSSRPFRIKVDFSRMDDAGGLTPQESAYVKEELLPAAVATISELVQTRFPTPPGQPFKLPQGCLERGVAGCTRYADISDPQYNCFFAPHNIEYFGPKRVCDTVSCTESAEGPGVLDADFIVYVSAEDVLSTPSGRTRICQESTLAVAAPCILDDVTLRPLAGNINLCSLVLQGNNDPSLFGAQLDVVVHELLHAMGFTFQLLDLFINPADGRTYKARGEKVIEERPGRTFVVTPNVKAATQQQLACSTDALLPGGPLENDGTDSTAGSHWETRLLVNELMNGANDGRRQILSRATLALLKDSGWYDTDLTGPQNIVIGYRGTCSFVADNCDDLPGFCSDRDARDRAWLCHDDYQTYGRCGVIALEDSCNEVISTTEGECYNDEFFAASTDNRLAFEALLQSRGAFARCVPMVEPFRSRFTLSDGRTAEATARPTGCFKMTCTKSSPSVIVEVDGRSVECPEGQTIDFGADTSFPSITTGVLGPCPSARAACPSSGCPNDCSGNGECLATADNGEQCQCFIGFSGSDCGTRISVAAATIVATLAGPPSAGSGGGGTRTVSMIGIIVGAVGGVLVLAALVFAVLYLLRRSKFGPAAAGGYDSGYPGNTPVQMQPAVALNGNANNGNVAWGYPSAPAQAYRPPGASNTASVGYNNNTPTYGTGGAWGGGYGR